MDEHCKTVLQRYFQSFRKVHGKIVQASESMFVTIQTLIKISEMHARVRSLIKIESSNL
jgi:hypothetical protein